MSCPDDKFSIIKENLRDNDTLFACVSVDNFLNYVAEGVYPLDDQYRDSDVSKLIENAVLNYYDVASWTNSGVTYTSYNSRNLGDGFENSAGKYTSCPDGEFSITKEVTKRTPRREYEAPSENHAHMMPTVITGSEIYYDYILFACVSVEDFLNYVAEGIYPAVRYKR